MVSLHPLAFLCANSAAMTSSSSDNAIKREVALQLSHQASAFADTQKQSSMSANNEKQPKPQLRDQNGIPINYNKIRSPLHFVFIVHGHQGRPTDLSYLHHTIKTKAKEKGKFVDVASSEKCVVGRIHEVYPARIHSPGKIRRRKRDRSPLMVAKALDAHDNLQMDLNIVQSGSLIVHNAAYNEGKTHDGIIKGGERLLDEILSVIRSEVKSRVQESLEHRVRLDERDPVDITISFVGNSLGGLYARYAIAHLVEVLEKEPGNNQYLFDGFMRVHLNVFCSTASPHLGCASFTYIPIPRTVEMGVAQILGETGYDLFRLNDLIHSMATSPRFLEPLALFRKRIAYANAFGTDFPVPSSTAAFLDKKSDYPHYFGDTLVEADTVECPASERGLIAAKLYTMPQDQKFATESTADNLTAMSSCLDSLGWEKIFVDIRKEIPSLPTLKSGGAGCPLSQLKSSSSKVRSCELEKVISWSSSHRLSLPLGHNAICAFSRGKVSSIVNSGGRPVMDSLAIDLIYQISSWNGTINEM